MTDAINKETLTEVLAHYGHDLKDCTISPLGNGLINTTYLVEANNGYFVLQRLNHFVFKSPKQVIDNADLISKHLQDKANHRHYDLTPIWQHLTIDKNNHVVIDGQYWRSLHYIANCYTAEAIATTQQASSVADAFAQFTAALNDFDSRVLAEIIPNFHDLSARITQLKQAIAQAKPTRLLAAKSAIDFCLSQSEFVDEVNKITRQLPVRVTHNDTKINNLLFNVNSNQVVAVIDLDTCMPGYLMHDFGDMVRSCCSSIAEDSADIEKMTINFELLSAFSQAYIAAFANKLTELEQHSLLLGVKLMPFMLAIRFLTDYLNDDCYFQCQYPEHNLVRSKNQLQMYRLLCQHKQQIAAIILPQTPLKQCV